MGLRGFALTAALLAIQAALMDRYYRQTLTQEPGKCKLAAPALSAAVPLPGPRWRCLGRRHARPSDQRAHGCA